MNVTQHQAVGDARPIWSTDLAQPPAGPPLAVGHLLLVPTQESGQPAYHATLHALSLADGSPCWQRPFEYALLSGLAITPTPSHPHTPPLILVSLTSTDLMRGAGALLVLDAAGEERYRWSPGAQRVSAPALADGAICVTADTRTLVTLDPTTGEERGRVELEEDASLSAPAVAGGVAYVPCRGPHLLAVGLDGQPRWRFDVPGSPDAWLDKSPVLVGERVFTVLSSGSVLALRIEDGSLAWRVDVGPAGKPLSPPATDGQHLYVGARDGLYALDLNDGHEVWSFPTSRRVEATPLVSDGIVYATCHDHHLYALDAASGREMLRYELGRRIEHSPVLAACDEIPCILVADRGGTLTAIARPLTAEEHEAAGHWLEAAAIHATQGQMLRQAQALEAHAQSLRDTTCSPAEQAAAWAGAAAAFKAEGRTEQAIACQREVDRCLQQPIITLEVKHEGLVRRAWSRLQFIVRNEGYGPARNLFIRASGEQFEGQVTRTQRIVKLRAGDEHDDWLDVRPREYGDSVPLRVSVEYEDQSGEPHSCEYTIHISVARTLSTRGAGGTVNVFLSGSGAVAVGAGAVAAGAGGVAVGGDVLGDVSIGEPESVLKHRRIDAAAPSCTRIGQRIDLLVQIRFPDSPLLGIEDWPVERQPSSIEQTSESVDLKFPVDHRTGKLDSACLEVRIVAPDFTVEGESRRRIEVPPDQYSKRISFLLTAEKAGQCRINVEVYSVDDLYLGTVPVEVETTTGLVTAAPTAVVSTLILVVMVGPVTAGAEPLRLPATTHVLSFDRLSPADFERLCLWLVEREGYVRGEHLGLAGSEQGRDVIAYKPTPGGEELWYFQCKRYSSIRAKTLKDEVNKYLQLVGKKPHLRPTGVVFVVSFAVSAKVRENVGGYCEQHGLAHEFWALTELDMRVKRYPDLLREFFNLAP